MSSQISLDRHTVGQILAVCGVDAWGVAANEPTMPLAPSLATAVSIMMRLRPEALRRLRHGPTVTYQAEYARVNDALDAATARLAGELVSHGCRAVAVPSTVHGATAAATACVPDKATTVGDGAHSLFSHKRAATRAGLGWIGKTALFVSPEFGPAVRLATLFTDLELAPGEPILSGSCGDCRSCVDACPADAGHDVQWRAGMGRDELFEATACERHMERYDRFGGICGICIAACPYSRAD
jgi:epoxyqueuosine reductase